MYKNTTNETFYKMFNLYVLANSYPHLLNFEVVCVRFYNVVDHLYKYMYILEKFV